MNQQLEEGLEKYRRKLNVIKHQTGLLYKDFHEKQQQWVGERDQNNEMKRDLQTEVEKNIVKLQEFDVNIATEVLSFLDLLSSSVFSILSSKTTWKCVDVWPRSLGRSPFSV